MSGSGYVHGFELDAGHSLHIYQGSLVSVQADALVSSDDNYLSAGGGVSYALAQAAGLDLRRECEQLVQRERPTLGDVVRTSAGALPCRYLYHAITIDFDHGSRMDEAALRRLIVNLLGQAAKDGVRTLGMPALGTGAAFFDLGLAAEIIIDELLARLPDTPIQRIVLALMGDEAERLFYERIVRSRADLVAASALRRRESSPEELTPRLSAAGRASAGSAAVGEVIEQFPNLIDEARLSTTAPDRPRLVDGLADLILKHADPEDVAQEILSSPACRNFRGTIKQRLMEFLYLSEHNLRIALGPALFKNKDLRLMAEEVGESTDLARDQNELVDIILRALCFNTLVPPVGVTEYIARTERVLADVRSNDDDKGALIVAAVEGGKILEQVLKDLLRMYAYLFWGSEFEEELVARQIVPARRDVSPVMRLTIGQAREALDKLNSLLLRDEGLQMKWRASGREGVDLLPRFLEASGGDRLNCQEVLQDIIRLRNASVHTEAGVGFGEPDQVLRKMERLYDFLCACQATGAYPDVLRYEGTFENRNGERFVYFLDEKGKDRKVRTDEKIDARRHYFCIATNNPIHLYPVLIPKL